MTKPYLYQVEYIESTGTQYIDTGFTGDQNTRIKLDFQLTDINSIRAVFGSRTYNGSVVTRGRYFYPILGEHQDVVDRFQLGYGTDLYRVENITTPGARYVIDLDKNVVRVNGVVNNTFTASTFTNPSSILLFNCHTGSSGTDLDTRYAKVKVYSCQIWDNGVIARDFIPVVDKDMIPALYDRVTGQMFYNRGTGNFEIGSIITQKSGKQMLRRSLAGVLSNLKKKRPYYCEVEYLESNGNQWFNTGLNINTSTDEVVFNFQLISITKYQWLMGEHDNGARFGIGVGDGTNLRNVAYGVTTYKVNDTEMYNSIHYFVANSNGAYLNGTQVHGFESFVSTNPIYMFALNLNGSVSSDRASGRIWKYTQKRNGRAIIDLIPVLDWNYTPCMYDKVTGQFFYNQGTGSFTYGREIHYVDYLESTGTQWIDTGIQNSSELSFDILFNINNTSYSGITITHFYGSRNQDVAGGGNGTRLNNLALEDDYFGDRIVLSSSFEYDADHFIRKNKNTVIYKGITYTHPTVSSITITRTVKLFGFTLSGGSSDSFNKKLKVKQFKMWDNDTLIRDYLPAIDENGVGFMFDSITHSCFLNAGTGSFQYPARQIDYIESSGTQYINTGVTNWNNTIEFETKLSIQQQTGTGYKSWFGCYDNWTNGSILPAIGTYTSYRVMSNFNPGYTQSMGTNIGIANGQVGIYKLSQDSLSWSEGSAVAFDRSREFTNTVSCYLFCTYFNNAAREFASFKMYYFKMWLNGGLVRDYIPVFQNGVAGMLDKANNVFYANDGTGDFLVGKITEPEYE